MSSKYGLANRETGVGFFFVPALVGVTFASNFCTD